MNKGILKVALASVDTLTEEQAKGQLKAYIQAWFDAQKMIELLRQQQKG
jgi:hypothetical protein